MNDLFKSREHKANRKRKWLPEKIEFASRESILNEIERNWSVTFVIKEASQRKGKQKHLISELTIAKESGSKEES
ncbi:hypothetical protein HYD97_00895 [Mycoplasmopsis bovis]|nr:hypothetical protein [Mycoplasmopsis bovis]QQH34352.1 hypothetical protein HYD97_00895 [Mycoplasmopsis bovis]